MSLERLQKEYPPGERGLGARVLREYRAIKEARAHGWRWSEIATEMGLNTKDAARDLGNAFARVARKIAAGQLVPPGAALKPGISAHATTGDSSKERARSTLTKPAGGFINVTPED